MRNQRTLQIFASQFNGEKNDPALIKWGEVSNLDRMV